MPNVPEAEFLDAGTPLTRAVEAQSAGVTTPSVVPAATAPAFPPLSADAEVGPEPFIGPLPDLPKETVEQLLTTLMRPDVWFVPPPTCNVVFPDEYMSLSFSRDMLREVSRLQLNVESPMLDGQGPPLPRVTFAPTFADGEALLGFNAKQEGERLVVAGLGSADTSSVTGRPVIFSHEKFTGIVPTRYTMRQVAIEPGLATSEAGAAAQQESQTRVEDGLRYEGLTADFQFLTSRYAARTLNVAGRFLPRVVPGFPALVVNRPQTTTGEPPTHFLGMVTSVTHNLGQEGGSTSFSLRNVRTHRGGELTDDLFIKEQILQSQIPSGSTAKYNLAVVEADSDSILLLRALKAALAGQTSTPGGIIPIPTGLLGVRGAPVASARVLDATPITLEPRATLLARPDSPALGGFVSDNLLRISSPEDFPFSLVQVVETLSSTVLPLEEAIRPAFISEEYSNAEIGAAIYSPLLGCQSIIDVVNEAPPPGVTAVTIEQATNKIVKEYSRQSIDSGAAMEYIYARTHRPGATLPEVIGRFHKDAFGDHENLENLDLEIPLSSRGGNSAYTALPALDPRKERRDAVLAYKAELLASQGLRG